MIKRRCASQTSSLYACHRVMHRSQFASQWRIYTETMSVVHLLTPLDCDLQAMETYSESVALELRELKDRGWVEVVAMPAKARVDAAEGKGEGSN